MIKKFFIITILFLTTAASALASIKELTSEKLVKKSPRLTCSAQSTNLCDYKLTAININWWDNFSDPLLKEYVLKAIERNHNLKKAALKSEEYRQFVKSTFADELPTLFFTPSFIRIKTAGGNQFQDLTVNTTRANIYNIPLFATYEADIFLKNHDKTKAKKKELESAEYEEKAAYISIAAEVSTLYINIIKLDKMIETQSQITETRKKIYELTKERNLAGLASTYDVTYTDRLHTASMIELNDLKRQRALLLHQFAVYIDENPACEENLKRNSFDKFEFKGCIPESISSEAALMRPDMMKAEADLQKAKIDVKIARKEFLPMIPIFGSAGYNSLRLKSLFNWDNISAFVGAILIEKLYTGGKMTANLRAKKIKYESLFENYKQTDLVAIQEINDALCLVKYDTKKDNENLKKLNLERKNFGLIKERYNAGIMSYLQMIQYKETLLSLQNEKDISKAQRLIDYLTLYKAAGAKL